jgi:hypothetical protein
MIELNWADSVGSTENTGENCYYPSLVFVMQGLMNSHGQELSSEDCEAVIRLRIVAESTKGHYVDGRIPKHAYNQFEATGT